MDCSTTLPFLLLFLSLFSSSSAVNFEVYNNCPFTVWAAATPIGGGKPLAQAQSWNINVPPGTTTARIWGRTNCNFDGSGVGSCQTGDCGGALQCTAWGKPPNTLAEFALNQYNNSDVLDISVVEGFNIPISFAPTTTGGGEKCRQISCTADIVAQCPGPLRDPGGCNNPCGSGDCIQDYLEFFKTRCPNAYSSSKDDTTINFTCLAGSTDYSVVFCP